MSAKRLLMVDDNPMIGDIVRTVAESLGYIVETFTESVNFEAAVARADPDLVILDLNIPETDGIGLLRKLADRRSRARIFIMSGMDPIHQMMAEKLGMSLGLAMAGIIPKPVRVAELRTMLASTQGVDQ